VRARGDGSIPVSRLSLHLSLSTPPLSHSLLNAEGSTEARNPTQEFVENELHTNIHELTGDVPVHVSPGPSSPSSLSTPQLPTRSSQQAIERRVSSTLAATKTVSTATEAGRDAGVVALGSASVGLVEDGRREGGVRQIRLPPQLGVRV